MEIIHEKNAAYYLAIPMVDSSTPANFKTGLSPTDTAYYKDGASAWASLAITDTFSEIASIGVYEIDLTASELNHDQVLIKVTGSGAADTFVLFNMNNDIATSTQQLTLYTIMNAHLLDIKGTGFAKDTHSLTDILADVTGLNGDVMRGTDSASTHSAAAVWAVGTRELSGTIGDFDALDTALDAAHGAGSWLTGSGGDATEAKQDIIIANQVNIEDDTQDIQTQIGTAGAGLTDLGGMSVTMKGQVNLEIDTSLTDMHLDHLFLVSYDSTTPPGSSTSFLNELTENDGGLTRFTANALEQGPGGGGDATEAKQDTIIAELALIEGGGFATGTDSLEAIRDRGDVAWITGGGAAGANQVTLTIEEADTTPLPNVKITVLNSDSTVVLATGVSDASGDATFALDDGTYKILLSRIGVTFTVPETLVVDETPETATYNGTLVAVGDPPVADLCTMHEYCMDQDGDPLASVTSFAAITDKPFDDGSGIYETRQVPGTYNAGSGLVSWDIVRGARVLIEIEEVGMHKEFLVPDQASARLSDLTPL